jgi:probable rRNA maturation factor
VDPDSKRPLHRSGQAGLRVTVSDGRGRAAADGGLARWLESIAPVSARGEVAVALVSDTRVRELNREYRRKNSPTDVLSFPADGGEPRGSRSRPPLLGDVVIATGVARRHAREIGHSYATELRVLALHGLLHLLGYDHDDAGDRGRMARVEARLRQKGRLAAGLIERQPAGRATRSDGGRSGRSRGTGGRRSSRGSVRTGSPAGERKK